MPPPTTDLPCSTILYRSVFRKHVGTGGVLPAAFLLRANERGLSVWLTVAAAWSRLRSVREVRSLHTGRIRDLGLQVQPDLDDPAHAEILGLPDPHADEASFLQANRLARQMLRSSRSVPEQSV